MPDGNDVTIVNVVGAGDFGTEISLTQVAADLEASSVRYDPNEHTGMYVRLKPDGALLTLYRTGSYHIVGVTSEEELFDARDAFISKLTELGVELDTEDDPFSVRNMVCTADYGQDVNLNALAIGLGLENVEYEPEQFPGLVYRPPDKDAVVIVFGSGKFVVTGVSTKEQGRDVYTTVSSEMTRLIGEA